MAERIMKDCIERDEYPLQRTAWDLVEELQALQARIFTHGIDKNTEMFFYKTRALLMAIPADAPERLHEAERRVKKMRHALALIQSGVIDASGFPQTVKDASLKSIEEALR